MSDKVTIIVPVYNIEKYVGDCIKSLINQTYTNVEILLINDGSKDNSLEICNYYSQLDDRVKVISKENGGLSSARNCGLDNANGDYILFVDGDDQLNKYALELLMRICQENDDTLDFVQFKYEEINDANDIQHYDVCVKYDFLIETEKEKMFDYLYLVGGEAVSSCTKLYKKTIFDKLRYKEGILHEDEYIITDIIDESFKCAYTNAKLYYYIMRDGSITHSKYSSRKKEVFLSIDKRMRYFKEKGYKELLKKEVSRYFVILAILYTNAKKSNIKPDCVEIKNRMKILLKNNSSIYANKNMNLLFRLCKINIYFLDVYAMFKNRRK